MNDGVSDLDKKIKDKFQLFSGVRSQDEDQKIYEEIYNLCFEEILAFLGENRDDAGREAFKQDLAQQKSDEDRNKTLVAALSKIEDYQSKLNQRMDTLLDKLLEASLATVKK